MSYEDLNQQIRESKLESIRKFLSFRFGESHTRESALNLVVESFFSMHATDIAKIDLDHHLVQLNEMICEDTRLRDVVKMASSYRNAMTEAIGIWESLDEHDDPTVVMNIVMDTLKSGLSGEFSPKEQTTERKMICFCGKEMKFDSILIPGIEESEDFYTCPVGHKIPYYDAIENNRRN